MLEWPSRSLTTCRSAPPASSHEAWACRSPCTVTDHGMSAALTAGSPGEVEFEVNGWPPKKAEARSLFAAGHPQADKARKLLEAAREAVQRGGWGPATSEVAFELTLHCPSRPAAEAP